jgi:histidinol-phosphate aminotransferase
MAKYTNSSQEAWNNPEALKLDWNESTLPILDEVKDILISAIANDNLHWYPDISQSKLRTTLGEYLELPKDNFLITSSSDSAHDLLLSALVNSGDKVVIAYPTYDNFRVSAVNQGAEVTLFPISEKGVISGSEIVRVISQISPRLVYLCNPNNPHGTLLDHDVWIPIIESNPDCMFLIDEAYIEFSPSSTFIPYVEESSNIIISRTFSKAFGLASFRVGYLIASAGLISNILPKYNWKSVNQLGQIAAHETLKNVDKINERINAIIFYREKLSDLLHNYENYLKIIPSHANFLLLKFLNLECKNAFVEALKNRQIYVRNLSHIEPLSNSVRITIPVGTDYERLEESIIEFIEDIERE